MYSIIGGDGKEYGPVTSEQIRAWIAAGRANLETQAKLVGTTEWRRVGDFPEFGGATPVFAAEGAPAAPPPPVFPVGGDAKTIANHLIAASGQLDISSCYERSWALLKANFWPLVGVSTLMLALRSFTGYEKHISFLGALLVGPLTGGLYSYILKKARGQPTTVGDAFAGFTKAFVPLLLCGLCYLAMICLGFVCLILPGIYLAVAYSFAFLLVIDRNLGFWTALEVSRRVISAQWWRIFGLILLAIPFILLGFVALVVGVLVAFPFVYGAFIYAYEDLCSPEAPATPVAPLP